MITEKDIALIDAFIAGELIGNDKTDFEARVKNDLEFAKTVRQQIHAVEHIEIFGAVTMGKTLREDMQQWKTEGGYKPYKSDMMAKGRLIKAVAAVAGLAIVGGLIWYFFLKEKPETPEPKEPTVEEANFEPEPPAVKEHLDTGYQTENLIELKTSEEQIADMQLNVKDPTTFSIYEVGEKNGIYTYQIAYDDFIDEFQSRDPDIDETLMKMAEAAIAENARIQEENERRARASQSKQKSTVNKATTTKTEKVVEKKPEPKPVAKPKPKPRRQQQKVEDDFPY